MDSPVIHRDMRVLEIATLLPAAVDIMAAYGLHCVGCSMGGTETLADGCAMHGYGDAEIDALLADLNAALTEGNTAPRPVRITAVAAQGLRAVATSEQRETVGLAILIDGNGDFCLEFRDAPLEGDHIFPCREDPGVCVYVSPLLLHRVGGATIDVRDGRFKLDLASACSCTESTCACRAA